MSGAGKQFPDVFPFASFDECVTRMSEEDIDDPEAFCAAWDRHVNKAAPELCGPIVGKDNAKHIAYSAVLVPGEPDADGEVLTAEKVEQVAHDWLETFRAFDVQHSVKKINAAPVESYLEPADRTVSVDGASMTLPRGTWTVGVKVHEDRVWNEILAGKRSGLSIMGVPSSQRDAAIAAAKAGKLEEVRPAFKRVTLADVGGGDPNGDWFAPFIGIVDHPAVPKAKFFALKSAPDVAQWIDLAYGVADKEGRQFSDANYRQIKAMAEAVTALLAEADKEREARAGKAHDRGGSMDAEAIQKAISESVPGAVKSVLDAALDEKLKPINERLDKIDPPESGEGGTDDTAAKGKQTNDKQTNSDELAKAIKAAVEEAVKPIAEKADRAEQRTRPGSRQPGDDDIDPVLKNAPDRDVFGRKIG